MENIIDEQHQLIIDAAAEVTIEVNGKSIQAKTIFHRDTGERSYWCPETYQELEPDYKPDIKISRDPFEEDTQPDIWGLGEQE